MPTKKKVTKKVAAKKPVVRARVARKPRNVAMQSFKLSKEKVPFVSFKITDQTIYWSALLILVLLLGLWVVNIQINISDILNAIKV